MDEVASGDVTRVLHKWQKGDSASFDQLFRRQPEVNHTLSRNGDGRETAIRDHVDVVRLDD